LFIFSFFFLLNQVKRKTKPLGAMEYTVEAGDTIEKIALKFNKVPSEIQHLNPLVSRVIFPGQVLFVPDPNYVPPPPQPAPTPTASSSPPMSPPSQNKLSSSIVNELNTIENTSTSTNNTTSPLHNQHHSSGNGFSLFKVKLYTTKRAKNYYLLFAKLYLFNDLIDFISF
jgi:LysM repeat protein